MNLKGNTKMGEYTLGISSSRPVTAKLMTSKEMTALKSKFAGAAIFKKGLTCNYEDGDGNMWVPAKEDTIDDLVAGAKAQKAKGKDCDKFAWAAG